MDSPKLRMKSKALSFAEVYQNSHFTSLFWFSKINSAERAACLATSGSYFLRKSFKICPSFLLMSMAGILMPVPVPSSLMMMFLTSVAPVSSMITAREPPALSMFLTF